MYIVKNFKTAREFLDFNKGFIYSNPMQNILLINAIEQVANNNLRVLQGFNLVGKADEHLLVFIVNGYCLIYCDKYDQDSLEVLSKELPFERLKDFLFAGDKETIENLLQLKKIKFNVEKHLITYKCERLNKTFKLSSGQMRLAKPSDRNYLANLSVHFTEEYDGNKESLSDMQKVVHNEMMSRSLYVWEDNYICAMAVEMNRQEFEYPEIGKLYTVPRHRNKGYSASLLYKLTEKILQKSSFSMLYTQGDNPASNQACCKVGYVKVGNYARFRLT